MELDKIYAKKLEMIKGLECRYKLEIVEAYPSQSSPSAKPSPRLVFIETSKEALGNSAQKDALYDAILALKPWRKGPFYFKKDGSKEAFKLDAEWNSEIKQGIIAPFLGDIEGKDIADIGCNNGFYLMGLLGRGAKSLTGYDPYAPFYLQFLLLSHICPRLRAIDFYLEGIDELREAKDAFDIILCLGVLYHRNNPIACTKLLRQSLRPGGFAIIDTLLFGAYELASYIDEGTLPIVLYDTALGIEADTTLAGLEDAYPLDMSKSRKCRLEALNSLPLALTPLSFASMSNAYFIPNIAALISWCRRAKFSRVELLALRETTKEEQRKSAFIDGNSLDSYLLNLEAAGEIDSLSLPVRGYFRAYR